MGHGSHRPKNNSSEGVEMIGTTLHFYDSDQTGHSWRFKTLTINRVGKQFFWYTDCDGYESRAELHRIVPPGNPMTRWGWREAQSFYRHYFHEMNTCAELVKENATKEIEELKSKLKRQKLHVANASSIINQCEANKP